MRQETFHMADFQLPDVITNKIKDYFSKSFNNEPCGLLIIKRGNLDFVPIDNNSTEPDTFSLDPVTYTRYLRVIYMIVHAHDNNCIPSEHDIIQCNLHNKPYLIFDLSNFNYTVIWPENYSKLCGKPYIFGTNDCFESAHKWYLVHGLVMPTRRYEWKDDWWKLGEDYISRDIQEWPFIPVDTLQYGDLLTFSMESNNIPNHLGIYIDQDEFFHHAFNRLSCVENLYPTWGKYIVGIYRYEKSNIRRLPRGQIW